MLPVREEIFASIPIPLVRYRTHEDLNRKQYHTVQFEKANMIRSNILNMMGLDVTVDILKIHLSLLYQTTKIYNTSISECARWVTKLINANKQCKFFDEPTLIKHLKCKMEKITANV